MIIKVNASKLTTVDNPFDPFDQFDDWYRMDMDLGYSSMCLLARYLNLYDGMTLEEELKENERAIDTIVLSDPLNLYKKVQKQIEIDIGD